MMKKRLLQQLFICIIASFCFAASLGAQENKKLTGTPIGSPNVDYSTGQSSSTVNTLANAFDGKTNTFYASLNRSNTWVGLDLGTPHVITRVGWAPRSGQPGRVQLGLFEGANKEDFTDAVPLYLIPSVGTNGVVEHADVRVSRGFRYVRYVGPNDARCNIAEVEFYGHEGVGDDSQFYQITNLPTLSIHTLAGTDPKDKVNEMPSEMVLVYDGGIRIQEDTMLIRGRGNASWGFPKKPYRIKFYSGGSKRLLKGSPLETPAKARKWTLINNYGDKTLMRNCVAFEMSRRLGLAYTPYCQPVDVVLNGEYKGCYQLCDQLTVDKNRVAITEMTPEDKEGEALTGGYFVEVDAYASSESSWFSTSRGMPVTIKSPDEDEINLVQKNYLKRIFNQMESSVFSSNYKDENTGYRSRLDVESFLKHFIVGELAGNTDTYWSTYMYKDRNEVPFHVGPVWDFDLAMDNDARIYPVNNRDNWVYRTGGSAAHNMIAFVNRILSDNYANKRLKSIWTEMRRSGAFSEESLVGYVDSMAQVLDASQRLNFIRWPILNQRVHQNPVAYGSYEGEVNVLREYFPARIAWIDKFLGYGVEKVYNDSVFYIKSAEDLLEFSEAVNSGANHSEGYLAADINMSGYGDLFVPIGNGAHPFMGIFDGRGHVIRNLKITGADNCGLFGTVSGGAQISNFIFDSTCTISAGSYVGVIGVSTGEGQITVDRVGNEASIVGTGVNVSGIIGCNYGSTCRFVITDCYNTGTIKGSNECAAICGWAGGNAVVSGCWNTGEVTGYISDLEMVRHSNPIAIDNCYNIYGTQVEQVTSASVASGELAFRLNEAKGEFPVWYQELGTDAHPVFDSRRGLVFRNPDGSYSNVKSLAGDVKKDDKIDVWDADWEAESIVGREPAEFFALNSDVNQDRKVDVLDVVAIINAVGGKTTNFTESDEGNARLYSSNASVKASNSRKVNVWLTSPLTISAYQADILVSDGLSVDTLTINEGNLHSATHVLKRGRVEGNARILGYSTDNSGLKGLNGTLLTFIIESDETFVGGTFTLANQLLTTSDGRCFRPEDATYTMSLSKTYVTNIRLSDSNLKMNVGDIYTLGVTVEPLMATNQTLTWKSSDEKVAKVEADGTITALSVGTATITVSATDGSGTKATVLLVVTDGTGVLPIESVSDAAEVYTVSGVRIGKPTQAGVYIVNGTKVLLK